MVSTMPGYPPVCSYMPGTASEVRKQEQDGNNFYNSVFHLKHLADLKVIKSSVYQKSKFSIANNIATVTVNSFDPGLVISLARHRAQHFLVRLLRCFLMRMATGDGIRYSKKKYQFK